MYKRLAAAAILLSPGLGAFQSDPPQTLEAQVLWQFRIACHDTGCVPIEKRLLALGEAKEVSRIVLDIAEKYKSFRPGERAPGLLTLSVFALGKLRETLAIPLLRELSKSSDKDLRVQAIQSIAEIDPKGNRDLLLEALHDDYYPVRMMAAQGLARTSDPWILNEIEVQAAREPGRDTFRAIQQIADEMRANIDKAGRTQ